MAITFPRRSSTCRGSVHFPSRRCWRSAPALVLRTSSAAPTPRIALDDPTIVAIFDAANTSDIETGELGAKKGTTAAVREFGAMLARDHKAVRQLGRDLAKKLG